MATSGTFVPSNPKDQAKTRASIKWRDNHGRQWFAPTELGQRSNRPVGELIPLFSAPIYPPQESFVFPSDASDLGTFTIDYDGLIQRRKEALDEWRKELVKYARMEYGDKAAEAIEKPPPFLLELVGPQPQPYQIWEAAKGGNQWILGNKKEKPDWARVYFPETTEKQAQHVVNAYPDADEESTGATSSETYPQHKGFGNWLLSDGTLEKMTKDEAQQREAALAA